jgi:hypothetical protein
MIHQYLKILLWTAVWLVYPENVRSFSPDLSQTYREIAQRANQLERWPDSQQFCDDCLVYNEAIKTFHLPSFTDGNGPIGVFGLLHRNPKARSILTKCDVAFDAFCDEIQQNILDAEQQQQQQQQNGMKDWILQSPPTSHHISVLILQEHPSFLRTPEDLEKWRPISENRAHRLSTAFARDHETLSTSCPELELDSLLWTPDGAMIAAFIDTSSDQSFDRLRHSCRVIAQDELGDILTTRPKNLIHSTIGRVIGLPSGASAAQHEALRALSRTYNEQVLPDLVESIRESHHGGRFLLEEVSLARNTIWMLQEYIEYASWSLVSP